MSTALDFRSAAPPAAEARNEERRFLLHGVPWWTYVTLRDALEETGVRMTYLKGALELMSPSILHEDAKTVIARLLEAWAMEWDVDLRGFGSCTFRKEAAQRGLEPDECYKLGPIAEGGVPDIAIEVVVSNPLVDKLAVYAGLGIPEVWVWSGSTPPCTGSSGPATRRGRRARSCPGWTSPSWRAS